MLNTLKELFDRDLNKLKMELSQYENEADIWKKEGDVNNTAGNLALHLCGNLKHFIGATIGKNGFKRDRDSEFTSTNVPLKDLNKNIDETREVVKKTLDDMSELVLEDLYPINVLRENMTTEFFLTHLSTHLTYHLGQVSYHRRLLAPKNESADA